MVGMNSVKFTQNSKKKKITCSDHRDKRAYRFRTKHLLKRVFRLYTSNIHSDLFIHFFLLLNVLTQFKQKESTVLTQNIQTSKVLRIV